MLLINWRFAWFESPINAQLYINDLRKVLVCEVNDSLLEKPLPLIWPYCPDERICDMNCSCFSLTSLTKLAIADGYYDR